MKRILIIGLAVVVLSVLGWLSVSRIPDGHVGVSGDRIFHPGLHVHAPWTNPRLFPSELQSIDRDLSILSKEGAQTRVHVLVEYRWDIDRLMEIPVLPDSVESVIVALPDSLNQARTAPEIPSTVHAALSGRLSALPIDGLLIEVSGSEEVPPGIRKAVHPTGTKILLIGLDGLDWVLLDRLAAEGKLPTFSSFKQGSAWCDLRSFEPVLSPLIWTSIASSRYPEDHGILDFVTKDPNTGTDVPITSSFRKTQTFWTILSALGLRVNVVGWWATFPAEKINGIMVSERLFYQLFGMEGGRDVEGNVYPGNLEGHYADMVRKAEDVDYDTVHRFIDISREEFDRAWEVGLKSEDRYSNRINHLRHILATTRSTFEIFSDVLKRGPWDLSAVYLEGTDTIGHRFGHYLDPKLSWTKTEDHLKFHRAMEEYYIYVDELVGRMLKELPDDTTVIITADHGFYTGKARPSIPPDDFALGAPRWHRMTGVFMIKGPGIRKEYFTDADIYDILPSIFTLLGFPCSDEFVGKPMSQIFTESIPAAAMIPTYETLPAPWKEHQGPVVPDEDRIKELAALGYLSPGQRMQGGEGSPEKPAEAESFTQLYNQAAAALERGDREVARSSYKKSVELNPGFGLGYFGLARMEAQDGRHLEAYHLLKKAFEVGKLLPDEALYHLVEEGALTGNLQDSFDFLLSLEAKYGREAGLYSALGMALLKGHREEDAADLFRQALAINPTEPVAVEELIAYHKRRGETDQVQRLLATILKRSEGSLESLEKISAVALRQGEPGTAEIAARKVLQSDPGNGEARANLAAALAMLGRYEESLEYFARALPVRPRDAMLRFNYGAALASLGRNREAIQQIESAEQMGLKNPSIYKALGMIRFRLGDKTGAKTALLQSLDLDPNQPDVREMVTELK
ncbi:MAG TPA: alkaline phosphatase family protein [Thermoanaerobaculia bacterium]|nr:alkaline phosphatase family protein [Thermoanaerobaculia bacterium]HUM30534.1 alkaline phosphatase family protein [Thermoanaerobaculia bacterium]HXK68726.1 alkaline phosphatase family protein [Thermoanaerobaculia bacterium]